MPDLMSLNDEIIDRIGYLLHRDNFILFPSFNPSWANFALEISPTVASDYLAFRSTCRRILSKCGLEGLHISLNVWGRLLKRLVYAPDQVKRVVSGRSIISAWTTLTTFLQNFRSLEELIIIDTPLCRHHDNTTSIRDLHHLTIFCLPQLSSLSFEMKCQEGSIYMPELLLGCGSNIRHWKTIDSLQLPTILQSIDCDNTHTPQPRTLCMKLFDGTSVLESVLGIIAEFCPQVTDLHLSMHESGEPYVFTPCAYISDFPSPSEIGELRFGLDKKSQKRGERVKPDQKGLIQLAQALSRLGKLRTLDCGLMLLNKNGPRPISYPVPDETQSITTRDRPNATPISIRKPKSGT